MRKLSILNCLVAFALLFSVAFQSVHSGSHLVEEFYGHQCEHRDTGSKHNFSHTHHTEEHCFVCHFSFASFLPTPALKLNLEALQHHQKHFFAKTQVAAANFAGSLFAYRGPPTLLALS